MAWQEQHTLGLYPLQEYDFLGYLGLYVQFPPWGLEVVVLFWVHCLALNAILQIMNRMEGPHSEVDTSSLW